MLCCGCKSTIYGFRGTLYDVQDWLEGNTMYVSIFTNHQQWQFTLPIRTDEDAPLTLIKGHLEKIKTPDLLVVEHVGKTMFRCIGPKDGLVSNDQHTFANWIRSPKQWFDQANFVHAIAKRWYLLSLWGSHTKDKKNTWGSRTPNVGLHHSSGPYNVHCQP